MSAVHRPCYFNKIWMAITLMAKADLSGVVGEFTAAVW